WGTGSSRDSTSPRRTRTWWMPSRVPDSVRSAWSTTIASSFDAPSRHRARSWTPYGSRRPSTLSTRTPARTPGCSTRRVGMGRVWSSPAWDAATSRLGWYRASSAGSERVSRWWSRRGHCADASAPRMATSAVAASFTTWVWCSLAAGDRSRRVSTSCWRWAPAWTCASSSSGDRAAASVGRPTLPALEAPPVELHRRAHLVRESEEVHVALALRLPATVPHELERVPTTGRVHVDRTHEVRASRRPAHHDLLDLEGGLDVEQMSQQSTYFDARNVALDLYALGRMAGDERQHVGLEFRCREGAVNESFHTKVEPARLV